MRLRSTLGRMKCASLFFLSAVAALAQPVPKGAGSVSGHFYDADTGAPLANFAARGPDTRVQTDDQGHYRIKDLAPGPQNISVSGWPDFITASVNVPVSDELTGVDFRFRRDGTISGRVADQDKDPIAGMRVCQMAREYYGGRLYYFAEACAVSDDRGQYLLRGVRAGRAVMVLAAMRLDPKVAISEEPPRPDLRRPAYRPTYYPSADRVQGAAPVTLRSAEAREHVDIQVLRSPQYCVEGLVTNQGAPAALRFRVTDELTASSNMTPGSSSSGGFSPSSGPDGKFRICDLYPGRFRIAAFTPGMTPTTFGVATVSIDKQDVAGVTVSAGPPALLEGDAVWSGTAPDKPLSTVFSISPRPVTNDAMPGRVEISPQGQFTIKGWDGLDYMLNVSFRSASMPNVYLKDAMYGSVSVLHQWLRMGSATGNAGLHLTLANDGGFVKVSAADASGKVAPNSHFLILPAVAADEGVLADAMVMAQGGPTGDYLSTVVPPGKYYVLATADLIDKTPESMAAIWRARAQGKEVDVAPGATASVTVETRAILPHR